MRFRIGATCFNTKEDRHDPGSCFLCLKPDSTVMMPLSHVLHKMSPTVSTQPLDRRAKRFEVQHPARKACRLSLPSKCAFRARIEKGPPAETDRPLSEIKLLWSL